MKNKKKQSSLLRGLKKSDRRRFKRRYEKRKRTYLTNAEAETPVIAARFLMTEYRAIDRIASKRGMTKSAFVHSAVMHAASRNLVF